MLKTPSTSLDARVLEAHSHYSKSSFLLPQMDLKPSLSDDEYDTYFLMSFKVLLDMHDFQQSRKDLAALLLIIPSGLSIHKQNHPKKG